MIAMSQIGTPYTWGGARPDGGFDCSGLVSYVYWQALRVRLPRVTYDQARHTQSITREEARPGDLCFFNTMRRDFSHVGIVISDDRFIHAPATGYAVRIESMTQDYWRERFNGVRRALS
jgi:cell wall-associated NlpC family hydrolase